MPVRLSTHNTDIDLTPGTTKSDIVEFLYNNPEYGYKPDEIQEHLDISDGTTTTTLKRLLDANYIEKTEDSYYHALGHQESLRRYVASLTQLERMFSHRPEESPPEGENPKIESINVEAVEAELAELEDELEE